MTTMATDAQVVARALREDPALEDVYKRQIQDFNRRYGLNAGNWRDTRNRWRLQTAVLLLSVPSLSIAEIAAKVGYRSPNALARAFAKVGFPAPAELRQELLLSLIHI